MVKIKYNSSLFILFILFSLTFSSSATNSSIQNFTDKEVEIGLYIINLGRFDITTGSFTADFYLSFKCKNKCPEINFEFSNGRANSIDKIIDSPKEKFYRIQANLVSPIDLKKFPFDKQKMQIIIEDKIKTKENLEFIPNLNETNFDSSIFFVGWKINGWSAYTNDHFYDVYNETYSQYVFEIEIERIKMNSIFKTLLPIIFIILVMLSSFVLDPDKITTRLSMVGSALIASVMFHVSINNQIPSVGYLTFIDKFMILSYFIILLSFIFNVILLELNERKKEFYIKKLHKITEFSVFFIVFIFYLILFLFFL